MRHTTESIETFLKIYNINFIFIYKFIHFILHHAYLMIITKLVKYSFCPFYDITYFVLSISDGQRILLVYHVFI